MKGKAGPIQCRLNGETVQNGNTRDMIFKIPELAHGDVVEVEIENVGVLRNRVIDERI